MTRGVVEKPLRARSQPPSSFRRKPESILMQKDKTPAFHLLVIDGNQSENKKQRQNKWSTSRLPPAFAGMTNKTAPPCKDRSRPVGRPRGGIVPTDSPPRLVSFTNSRNQGFFNSPFSVAFDLRRLLRVKSIRRPCKTRVSGSPPTRSYSGGMGLTASHCPTVGGSFRSALSTARLRPHRGIHPK